MWAAADSLDWDRDGQDWPHRETSRFVEAAGITWHVQRMGRGPRLMLIHGTGASTHSWRQIAPLLAQDFEIVAFDLPGHGFTRYPPAELLTLPGMARGIRELIRRLDFQPQLVVGHSAGAAIAVRMSLDGFAEADPIISLNGALLPFPGLARHVLPPLAKLLYSNRIAPRLMAWRARDPGAVSRLLEGMGSKIDADGLALYRRLFSSPAHASAAIAMMASWDLVTLEAELANLRARLVLIAGSLDRAIPAEDGLGVHSRVRRSSTHLIRNAGHLVHEEKPEDVAALIVTEAAKAGLYDAGKTSMRG